MDDKVQKSNIDWKHWLHMSEIRIGQAVALSMNLDPHMMKMVKTCEGWEYPESVFQNKKEEGDFYQRCILLIDNAFSNKNLRSTESLLVGINQQKNHTAKIYLEYFPEWALSVEWNIPKELKILVDPENLPKETKQEEAEQEETELDSSLRDSHFDPLPRQGIIKLFYGVKEEEWDKLFKNAYRNGLKELKEEGSDKYNPFKVGEWLVKQGYYSQQHIHPLLVRNLPPRSEDIKDLLTNDIE
jgi:hypothetical protein